jgi:hypothetical protein
VKRSVLLVLIAGFAAAQRPAARPPELQLYPRKTHGIAGQLFTRTRDYFRRELLTAEPALARGGQ